VKKFLLIVLVLFMAAGVGIWHYRYDIFQFSAEAIIKNMLPKYVHVERLIFDLEEGLLTVEGFSIRNPGGFQNRHMATIGSITCRYKMRGNNILDGIDITKIEAVDPLINIERLSDGRLNVNELGTMMSEDQPKKVPVPVKQAKQETSPGSGPAPAIGDKKISDLIGLTDKINVKNGKFTFLDKAISARPFYMTFEDVNGDITLRLNNDYTAVLGAGTTGQGFVNGDSSQPVKWIVHMDPTTPKLTMSNRIEPDNVDIIFFKPYYDKYSPIDIQNGRFSGTLVFDFDNGNIGSTNILKLKGLKFIERSGGFASGFWDVSIQDIVRYLETSPGEILFDFKIKGPMDSPRFYPGPNVSRAIQNMAVDKISELIQKAQGGPEESAAPAPQTQQAAPKSDAEVMMDIIQGLMKK
jgi:hypothetical protein